MELLDDYTKRNSTNDHDGNALAIITQQAKEAFKSHKRKLSRNSPQKRSRKVYEDNEIENKSLSKNGKWGRGDKKQFYTLSLDEQKQRSVIQLTHIPRGMEEKQLKEFFRQFGVVTRVALKRTKFGKPLQYAYVEFADPNVGNIASEAVDGTMISETMIYCRVVSPKDIKRSTFQRVFLRTANNYRTMLDYRTEFNNAATVANLEVQSKKWRTSLRKDDMEIQQNLIKHGIDKYNFAGFHSCFQALDQQTKKDKQINTHPPPPNEEEKGI